MPVRLLFVWLLLGCRVVVADPMVIIHGERSAVEEPKNAFKLELLKLLLDVTKPQYGDYEIRSYTNALAAKRQTMLISEGDQLNVLWASPGTPISHANVIEIPIDLLQGLLGYRVCLTVQNSRAPWSEVMDRMSLHYIRIGQVDHWPDADVYRYNRIPIVGTPSFDGLYDMLAAGRFDCLPLGADEIEAIYRAKQAQFPMLKIDSELLIFYDYPLYLYVSAKHPEIAERLKRGFSIVKNNGDYDRLFQRYFHRELMALNLPARRLICLKSPFLQKSTKCDYPEQLPYYRAAPAIVDDHKK